MPMQMKKTHYPMKPQKFMLEPIERHSVLATTTAYEDRFLAGSPDVELLRQVTNLQRMAAEQLDAIEALRRSPDPAKPAGAHIQELHLQAHRYAKRCTEQAQKAREAMVRTMQDLDTLMNYELKPSDTASEVRAVLRGMNDEVRQQTIEKALHNRDKDLLAAVASSHPVTSGIDADYHASVTRRAAAALNPDLMARRDRFAQAADLAENVRQAVADVSKRIVSEKAIETVTEAQIAHETAMRKLLG